MSEDKPRDKPRKIYKKIYREKGHNCDGSKRKELDDADRADQLYNLEYGRLCMAYKMEGLPKPPKLPHGFRGAHTYKGEKYYSFAENSGDTVATLKMRHLKPRPPRPKKTKTTNYFYY